jgi:putative ABC transport system permease protein
MLVGGIGIMNIMLAVIAERKREIGIRRAVGASQRRIMAQFLSESAILTTVGGITGIVTGAAFTLVAAAYSGWEVVISPWAAALSLGMSTVAGIFFGLYPAYLAAKTDPIEALRGE